MVHGLPGPGLVGGFSHGPERQKPDEQSHMVRARAVPAIFWVCVVAVFRPPQRPCSAVGEPRSRHRPKTRDGGDRPLFGITGPRGAKQSAFGASPAQPGGRADQRRKADWGRWDRETAFGDDVSASLIVLSPGRRAAAARMEALGVRRMLAWGRRRSRTDAQKRRAPISGKIEDCGENAGPGRGKVLWRRVVMCA